MQKKGRKHKTDKKRKHRLSTEEILKLIKKVKPKQSQVVRVVVGDTQGKKTSHGPAYVPAKPIVTYGVAMPATPTFTQGEAHRPPAPPIEVAAGGEQKVPPEKMKVHAIKKVPPVDYAPSPSEFKKPFDDNSFDDNYNSFESKLLRFDKDLFDPAKFNERFNMPKLFQPRSAISGVSSVQPSSLTAGTYADMNPIGSMNSGLTLGLGGGMSMSIKPSSLSGTSSQQTHFAPPIQNDIYLPAFASIENDQAGEAAAGLSSDEFTLTPEGEAPPLEETNPESIPEAAVSENIGATAIAATAAAADKATAIAADKVAAPETVTSLVVRKIPRKKPAGTPAESANAFKIPNESQYGSNAPFESDTSKRTLPSAPQPSYSKYGGKTTEVIDFLNSKIKDGSFQVDPSLLVTQGRTAGKLKSGTSSTTVNRLLFAYEDIYGKA